MAEVNISIINDPKGYEDRYEIIGEPKYKYYVEAKELENLLVDWSCGLSGFPMYLTITTYNDYEEFETLLKSLGQEYEVNSLADIAYVSTEEGGTLRYNIPVVKVKITDGAALESIIRNSFWMAESNCTFILSISDNVSFKNDKGKDWEGKEAEFSTFMVDMSQDTMALGIAYDAQGLLLFSNLEDHRSVDTIAKKLPNYSINKG